MEIDEVTPYPLYDQSYQNIGAISVDDNERSRLNSQYSHDNAGDQFGQRSRARLSDQSHYIVMFTSSERTVSKDSLNLMADVMIAQVEARPNSPNHVAPFIELDSHADTTCAGANCHDIAYTDKICSVSPYHPKYKTVENVPVVQAATA